MCGRRMLVGDFTVLVRRSCMLLCLRVLANGVMVLSLMVVMCSGVMMSCDESVFERSGHRFARRKRVKTRIWSFGSD